MGRKDIEGHAYLMCRERSDEEKTLGQLLGRVGK
jgi:hypothetical protein